MQNVTEEINEAVKARNLDILSDAKKSLVDAEKARRVALLTKAYVRREALTKELETLSSAISLAENSADYSKL